MEYKRMPIEIESPEEIGYGNIKINLAESSAFEIDLNRIDLDIKSIKPEYTDHRGHFELRKLIALEGSGLNEQNVLITGGAAMAMFFVYSALLKAGDRLAVAFPNYSSNLQGPISLGCEIIKLTLRIENNWSLDVLELESALRKGAKMISLTSPHNPTGSILEPDQINALLSLTEKYQVPFLFDETYRDACFFTETPLFASYHTLWISIISFSKGYGMPGIRIGAIITTNQEWYELFLAAKETIQIANPPMTEAIAYEFYKRKTEFLTTMNDHAQANLEILKSWLLNEHRVEAVVPKGGLVCFVKINSIKDDEAKKIYNRLFEKHGIIIGPGHWFDMPDNYMRLGFGYPNAKSLLKGLEAISIELL